MMKRREFTFGSGALAMTAASYSRVLGANERIPIGVIGCGSRGQWMMKKFQENPAVSILGVCDVWRRRAEEAQKIAPQAKCFQDYRKLLEMREIQAVLIATPDHWHASASIDAMNAGKDVYVEKPLTLTPAEGPLIIRAARQNKRICQVGMQRRSSPEYRQIKQEFIDSGRLGKVTMARTWWHGNFMHLAKAPAELAQQPEDLDWGQYLGPVKWRDWDPQRYWCFRAYLEFGGGQVTDLFTHWIDMVHLLLGQDVPTSAVAAGGIYNYKDGRTAPDTITVLLEYPGEFTASFEGTLVDGMKRAGLGMELCGTGGKLSVSGTSFQFMPAERNAQPVVIKSTTDDVRAHIDNFLDCVRSRQLPNGDVAIGHHSAVASHLGNIAWVERRRIRFDPVREEILPG